MSEDEQVVGDDPHDHAWVKWHGEGSEARLMGDYSCSVCGITWSL